MKFFRSTFRLKVRQVDQSCVFDLSNSNGVEISATLRCSETLIDLYQHWQQIYRRRYELKARARVGSKSGSGTPISYDWDQELLIAETALLHEFHHWLGQTELLAIRETIQRSLDLPAQQSINQEPDASPGVNILLECSPIALARLPWETWKLAPKDSSPGTVRIARTCMSLVAPPAPLNPFRRGKLRVLAILAKAPDLNHDRDQKILRSLHPFAEIEFVHCQEFLAENPAENHSQQVTELKKTIADAIADQRGWDVLFFAGHSDEAATTGGQLELAPQTLLSIHEIESQLSLAKQRGLQLAVFNSCSGLHIADSLIRLGLPQVVVMRERIQDAVAHKFLEQLCRSLIQHKDIHTAVLDTYQYFATEQISYPSAHLIPSLFRHPDPKAILFRIEPSSLQRLWQQWQPTRWDAIALSTISLLSLLVPVQDLLSEARYWSQAVYRQTTHQFPPTSSPPVTLLEIDQASIDRKGIDAYKIKPMSRSYLAELVDRLRQLQVDVVGVDYLLDGSTYEDSALTTAVQTAVQQQTWIVFATRQNDAGQPIQVTPTIAKPDWILQGDIDVMGWDVMLPARSGCRDNCPFAYQLTLAQILHADPAAPQPQIHPSSSLQSRLNQYLQASGSHQTIAFLKQPKLLFNMRPIIDLSLPPSQVYRSLAAWDFLERPLTDATLKALQNQVVIIGSGGYDQADDSFPVPLAVRYWRSVKTQPQQPNQSRRSQIFPGAAIHAYTIHHFLSQHRLLWVPDLWLIGLAAIVGKGTLLLLMGKKPEHQWRLMLLSGGGSIAYGLISLQSYIAASILLPWFLPSVLFWLYLLPALKSTLPPLKQSNF
jgi:CHASE2 domain-containing sensor protein